MHRNGGVFTPGDGESVRGGAGHTRCGRGSWFVRTSGADQYLAGAAPALDVRRCQLRGGGREEKGEESKRGS
jgi:hypothetical protein